MSATNQEGLSRSEGKDSTTDRNSVSSQGLTNEQRRLIRHRQEKSDPRFYIRYNWRHPSRPQDNYDFRTEDGERKLDYLLDDRGPLNPKEWGDINLFQMARGCLKTTSVLGITNWALDKYPHVEAYMSAPTEHPPIKEFVDKFNNHARDTPLWERNVKDALQHHKFTTELPEKDGDGTYEVHSSLKTQTAYGGGEKLRGPHSQIGIIDEFQDVDESAFSVFMQMIDQGVPDEPNAPFPTIFLIGTPKEKNTFYHTLWLKSNQRSWDAEEGEWIDHSDVGEYAPTVNEDGEEFEDGEEPESFTIKAWHIDQINSPLKSHKRSRIEFYKQTYSERKFTNEILSQFYSPEDDLLGQDHVLATFDENRGFRNSRRFEDTEVVITADWGGGSGKDAADTVFTAAELIEDEDRFVETEAYLEAVENDIYVPYQIHILKHDFLDHGLNKPQEEEKFRRWVEAFNPDSICIDQGHNGSRRSRLKEDYGDIVKGIKYGNVSPPTEIRWKENELGETIIANVDKTHCCEKFVDYFKDGRFVIPSQDIGSPEERGSDAQKLISHLTAPFEEQKKTASGNKRLYIQSDRNDDSFDTFVYQYVGHDFMTALTPQIGPDSIQMTARRGY